MKNNIIFSHNTDHWKTPSIMYHFFMNNGYIDPCPFHSDIDNLTKLYYNEKLFINPPYSHIKEWVIFIKNNLHRKNEIILLIPARTDTKYFHELLSYGCEIQFIKGRLHFNDSNSAPFPSLLIRIGKVFNDRYIFDNKIVDDIYNK